MKIYVIILLIIEISVLCYDRGAAVNYATQHWNRPNHICNSYSSCSPYSYWGSEACGYGGQGGDCANFVSQCILAGGHAILNQGECRGYPCGVEEIGATRLGNCLANTYGWKSTCDYLMPPPGDVRPGDVIIYHVGSCWNYNAHSAIVISTNGGSVQIACHSNNQYGVNYNYMGTSMPYYQWLRNPN